MCSFSFIFSLKTLDYDYFKSCAYKKNMVEYDEEHCKILSIDNLEITKNDYNYKKNENVII